MSHITQNPANFPTLTSLWSQLLFDGTSIHCPRLDRSCSRTTAGIVLSSDVLDFIRCSVGFHLIDRNVDHMGRITVRCNNGFTFLIDTSTGLDVTITFDLSLYDESTRVVINDTLIGLFFDTNTTMNPTDFDVNHLCDPIIVNYQIDSVVVAMYAYAYTNQVTNLPTDVS